VRQKEKKHMQGNNNGGQQKMGCVSRFFLMIIIVLVIGSIVDSLNKSSGGTDVENENNYEDYDYEDIEETTQAATTEERITATVEDAVIYEGNVVINGYSYDTTYNLDLYDKELLPNCSLDIVVDFNYDKNANFLENNGITSLDEMTMNFNLRRNGDYFDEITSSKLVVD
jgi:hypothetical protein